MLYSYKTFGPQALQICNNVFQKKPILLEEVIGSLSLVSLTWCIDSFGYF